MKKSKIVDGVQELCLETWREFFQLTTDEFATAPAYIYRGQSNYNWPLVSTLDRLKDRFPKRKNHGPGVPDFFDGPPLDDGKHLNAFKRANRGRRGPNPPRLTDDEYWALGQHHGLATPLLDWTRSPFIALFFAFEQEKCFVDRDNWGKPKHCGVYVLNTSAIEASVNDEGPAVRVLSPETDANYRLIS